MLGEKSVTKRFEDVFLESGMIKRLLKIKFPTPSSKNMVGGRIRGKFFFQVGIFFSGWKNFGK